MSKISGFHRNYYRPQTEKKLRILRKYMGPWLDIWSSHAVANDWFILDLFAGSGVCNGQSGQISGSPLLYLEEIDKRREKLERRGRRLHLIFVEQDPAFFVDLQRRVVGCLHDRRLNELVEVSFEQGDCNEVVREILPTLARTNGAPAFVFVDPCNIDVSSRTMDTLLSVPWRADVLLNYMLYAVKRDVGCMLAGKRGSVAACRRLESYFGKENVPKTQEAAEDAETYARPVFCQHGHKVVVFHMEYPGRQAHEYYLMFASKNDTVSARIVPDIYAKEYTDRFGQGTLLSADEFLKGMKVIG